MAVINAFHRFKMRRRKSIPICKVPGCVREAFNIDTMYESGIAKLEPGKKNCLYDRCYAFEEVNYINRDRTEKESFLKQFMGWLKGMNMDFKITVASQYQSIEDFLDQVRQVPNRTAYQEIWEGIDAWTREKLKGGNPNVTMIHYLTVSCRAASLQDAEAMFNALDTTIQLTFGSWQTRIYPLDARERCICLHSLLCPGQQEESILSGRGNDWKNDVLPRSLKSHSNFFEADDTYMSVLFGWKYRSSIDPDRFIRSFSNMEFPSFLTMDFAPVAPDEIRDYLAAAGMNVEKGIQDEEQYRRKKNMGSTGPSYVRQRKKEEVESLQDQVLREDESGFFMNFLIVVTAEDEAALAERISKYKAIGGNEGVVIETANWQQIKALNTALPIGGRQVDYMRFFLSSSIVAFQPFYAQDIIEPGGYVYGRNRTTNRLIIGNRKKLMNPHGIIIGHTGTGKSLLNKLTEVSQTMLCTDDDVLILDPQNEFMDIVDRFGGVFFDLSPGSRIYLNGFEVSDEIFYGDEDDRERFMAAQSRYAKSLMAAIMSNMPFTQEHAAVVGRCTRRMYENTFAAKKLKKQPTLRQLREEIRAELKKAGTEYEENIIRPIYHSLEEYTEGACSMLARPSNLRLHERLVAFGLKNVPEDNWEAVMLTVMHYTSMRMQYNQKERRAIHFIVDETQILSRKGSSAAQLNEAVATFRKFGGMCTLVMQNLSAALHNEELAELFSNCSYKCFLDQGGVDANALARIQKLSHAEYEALSSDEPGQGVMVWGKKVVLFDAGISRNNPLYDMFSTNFHEEKRKRESEEYENRNREDAWEEANSGPGVSGPEGREAEERGPGAATPEADRPGGREKNLYNSGMTETYVREPDRYGDVRQEPVRKREGDPAGRIILQMASYQDVSMKDILSVLEDFPEELVEEKIQELFAAGHLLLVDSPGGIRYRKAG